MAQDSSPPFSETHPIPTDPYTETDDPLVRQFLDAVRSGDSSSALSLLAEGLDPNSCTSLHHSLLLVAAEVGQTAVADELLKRGAKVEGGALSQCSTPLMAAARCGHTPMVELLLSHGADANRSGFYTPLFMAALSGKTDVVLSLLKAGANPNGAIQIGPYIGQTPLMAADEDGYPDVAKLLVEMGATVPIDSTN